MNNRYLFASYARDDIDRVLPITEAVRKSLAARSSNVELWTDLTHLKPGEQWNVAIKEALSSAVGFLFFVSPDSLQSEWVRRELDIAAAHTDRLLIPVILSHADHLPRTLRDRQWLDLSTATTPHDISHAAERIVDAVTAHLGASTTPSPPVGSSEALFVAAEMAESARKANKSSTSKQSYSVFVVHGHSTEALSELESFLASVAVSPVVLAREEEMPQSLFQKFMSIASRARFAIVLLGADDYGASRRQYDTDGVGERALQFRGRQNVLLELGFFYGRLGWENVFVLYEKPDRVFPNFELPSDLAGIVFDSLADPKWRAKLGKRLADAGLAAHQPAQPAAAS